jgi:hypothetical protein
LLAAIEPMITDLSLLIRHCLPGTSDRCMHVYLLACCSCKMNPC